MSLGRSGALTRGGVIHSAGPDRDAGHGHVQVDPSQPPLVRGFDGTSGATHVQAPLAHSAPGSPMWPVARSTSLHGTVCTRSCATAWTSLAPRTRTPFPPAPRMGHGTSAYPRSTT